MVSRALWKEVLRRGQGHNQVVGYYDPCFSDVLLIPKGTMLSDGESLGASDKQPGYLKQNVPPKGEPEEKDPIV